MNDPAFVQVIYIRAEPEVIWLALTDPNFTRRFWFGRRIQSDFKAGSPLTMLHDDKVDFAGTVLESDPPRRLVFSFHDADSVEEDEGPSRVTYDLRPVEGSVRLTVTHDDFPAGSRVRQGVGKGWPVILSALKSLLETGEAIPQVMD